MKGMMNVRDRHNGRIRQAYAQSVDLNHNGKYVLRYIIGIQGYSEFSFLHAIYDNDEFNDTYEVVKWDKDSKKWIAA